MSATDVTVTGCETSEPNSNLWDWKIKIMQKWQKPQFGEWSIKAGFKRQTISHKLPCLKINFRVCSSYKKGLGFYSNFFLLFFLKNKQCWGYFFLTPVDFIRAKCYVCGSSGMCTHTVIFFNLRGNKEWPQIKPIPTLDNMTVESVALLYLLFCQCWCDRRVSEICHSCFVAASWLIFSSIIDDFCPEINSDPTLFIEILVNGW